MQSVNNCCGSTGWGFLFCLGECGDSNKGGTPGHNEDSAQVKESGEKARKESMSAWMRRYVSMTGTIWKPTSSGAQMGLAEGARKSAKKSPFCQV